MTNFSRSIAMFGIMTGISCLSHRAISQPLEPLPAGTVGFKETGNSLRRTATDAETARSMSEPIVVSKLYESEPSGKFAIPINLSSSAIEQYEALVRLPAIESFFFGLPETVCFPDERVQVQNTQQMPYSANCQLVITMNDGSRAIGTGWLLGPRLVVTAGHCVHEGESGQFFREVEVIPGMNGPVRPFGSQVRQEFRASNSWKTNGAIADDYGAILLDRSFQNGNGDQPGNHSIAVLSDVELSGMDIYLSGYPADKQFGSQWTDSDPVSAVLAARLRYMIDTYGGHSGSAVISVGKSDAIGIHNYGGCPNNCTRITQQVKGDLDQWLADSNQP